MKSQHRPAPVHRRGKPDEPREPEDGWPIRIVGLCGCVHANGKIHWTWSETVPGREWWRQTSEHVLDNEVSQETRQAVAHALRDAATVRMQLVDSELELGDVPW